MKNLEEQLKTIQDLKVRRETAFYRYFNRENQLLLLNLIIDELQETENNFIKMENELYLVLSNPGKLVTKNIGKLCELYKQIIILKTK